MKYNYFVTKKHQNQFLMEENAKLRQQLAEMQSLLKQDSLFWFETGETIFQRNENLRSLMDQIPVAIFRSTLSGRMLSANQAMINLFAYPDHASILNISAEELYVDPVDRKLFFQAVQETEQKNVEQEILFMRQDKTTFWGKIWGYAVRNSAGQLLYFQGTILDISQHRQIRLELGKEVSLNIQRTHEQEIISAITKKIRQPVTRNEIIHVLVQEIVYYLHPEVLLFYLLEGNRVVISGMHGSKTVHIGMTHLLAENDPLWEVIKTKHMKVFIDNRKQCPNCETCAPYLSWMSGIACDAIVPIQTSEGEVIGLIQIALRAGEKLHEVHNHLNLLRAITEVAGNALQRAAVTELLEQRLMEQSQRLMALYEVTILARKSNNIDEILQQVLEELLVVVDGNAACIHEVQGNIVAFRLLAQTGLEPGTEQFVSLLPSLLGTKSWSEWRKDDSIMVFNLHEDVRVPVEISRQGFSVYFSAPILLEGKLYGFLTIFRKEQQRFSLEDVATLMASVDLIGISIENIQLRHWAEETAAMRERQRLARDLHDSASQSTYSLSLLSRAALDLLEEQNFPHLQTTLQAIRATSIQALREMRLLLYELRPDVLTQEGLKGAIQLRLDAVERRTGIQADVMMEDVEILPLEAQQEIYQVIIEALNNTLKHSGANQVLVQLNRQEEDYLILVQDNGCGFDPAKVGRGGMGLVTMRERVENLGGTLNVESLPQSDTQNGTQVHVRLNVNNLIKTGDLL